MSGHAWLGAVLAAALMGIEILRRDRSQLSLRLVAVLAATASLAILTGYQPSVGPRGSPIHLLTPGYLGKSSGPGVFSLDAVASLGDLANRIAPQSRIELDGWGLLAHEWPSDPAPQVSFAQAAQPAGVSALDAPVEVMLGEPLVVKGRVTLQPGDSAWIVLEDPAGPRDSVVVSSRSPEFALSDRPRQTGAASYRLRLGLHVDTLGVAIRDAIPPVVLVLDASPSFETAYLKRWLAGRGARVVIRTSISRRRARIEEVNASGTELGSLTDASLSGFDIILADGGSLAQLSPAERSSLMRAVQETGIGLMLTADIPRGLATGGVFSPFRLSHIAEVDERRTRPIWPDAPRHSRVAIETEASVLASGGSLVTLVSDETGHALAQKLDVGAGRVGVTLLRAPSRWVLEGESDQFASYWSRLIGAVARDTTSRIDLQSDGPRRPDHPITIWAISPGRRAGSGWSGGSLIVRSPTGIPDTLATSRDPFDPGRWSGRFWPRSPGWHRLELAGGRTVPFRVSPDGEWTGIEANARLTATRARLSRAVARPQGRSHSDWLTPLAFVLLVLSLSWLWWEGRRRSR